MILRRWTALCVVFLAALSLVTLPAPAEPSDRGGAKDGGTSSAAPHGPFRHVPDEILIKLRADVSSAAAARALAAVGSRETHRFRTVEHLYRLKLAPGLGVHPALRALRRNPDVVYAEPNFVIQTSQAVQPNDPHYPYQWALQPGGINTEGAWSSTTGSAQVVVAVLDTGVDTTHEDLTANIFTNDIECSPDYWDHDGNGYYSDCTGVNVLTGGWPFDDNGHGTHVAGIIGAVGNNLVGVSGVNWTVKILPCKFLDANGTGTAAGAIACLDYVAAMKARGANIVATNNSWLTGEFSQALHDAIRAHRDRGIVFVTPAGNAASDNDTLKPYPCAFELSNIICVGATDQGNNRAGFSSWGHSTVHLNAPGVGIVSTWPWNSYQSMVGTSIAGAHVSGVVALLAAQDPTRDWRALKNLVLAGAETTQVWPRETVTAGRLNAASSLTCSSRYAYGRLGPRGSELRVEPGTSIDLAFLLAVCADPYSGPLSVRINETNEMIPLTDDGLGRDQVAGDAVFTGTWTAPQGGGIFNLIFPDSDGVRVTVEPAGPQLRLKPGFPVKAYSPAGGYTMGQGIHVLVGNIDADPLPEILVSGLGGGELHAFKGDGTAVPGWPTVGPPGAAYPVLGQLTAGSPALEVFAGYSPGGLAARSGDGALLPGWPRQASNYIASPATLADIDGDGIDEIFTEEQDWKLHAYRANGSLVPGWPHAGFYGGQERHTSAVGDLDGDGRLEIVTASGWSTPGVALLAHRSDGTLMPGFPVMFSGHVNTYPVIADVDGGDAMLEIIVPGRVGGGDGVYIYSATGTLKRTMQAVGSVSYGTAIALADLDGDGLPEIIMQTDSAVNVWKGNGTPLAGWPVALPQYAWLGNASPVVGDVDGDGLPEVVVLAPISGGVNGTAQLLVFTRNGMLLPGFPKPIEGVGFGAVPAIADIDGDGRNDIIVASDYWSGTAGYFDKVWAFDFTDTPTPHGQIFWGQFMGGPKHQGAYGPEPTVITYALNVALSGAGSGQVTSSPAGINCGADCSKRYLTGTSVTLTATPGASSVFAGWGGACAGQGNPCSLSMSADRTVTANFAVGVTLTVAKSGAGTGTITSSPPGVSCGSDCSETYASGTTITLTAAQDAASTFTGWAGACAGQGNPCTLTLTADQTTTATFVPLVNLTIQAPSGSGVVTSSPAGIDCGTDCVESYPSGTSVTLSFTPAPRFVFVAWTGGCAGQSNPCSITLTGNTTVGVSVAPLYALTVTRAGSGAGTVASSPPGVTCGSDCGEDYREGTMVTLTATPASGSVFTGWTGACSGQATTCSVATISDLAVTATFEALYTLAVTRSGTAGTVTSAPAGITCGTDCAEVYVHGTSVTLTAGPGSGSAFASWSGACAGQGNPCTVGMTESRSVTATFATARTLSVSISGPGSVRSADGRITCPGDCSEVYANGSTITLTATPSSGATFQNWSGACSGSSPTCTVTMTGNRSVTARFKR